MKREEEYELALGAAARERQERLAQERFACCGMPRETGHHEMCPRYVPPEPVVGEEQTSLL